MTSIFSCLEAGTANVVYSSAVIASLEQRGFGELSEQDESCLMEVVSGLDVRSLMASGEDFSDETNTALVDCVLHVIYTRGFLGLSQDDLSGEEKLCIREVFADPEVAATLASGEDPPDGLFADTIACVSPPTAELGPPLSLDDYAEWCFELSQIRETFADEVITASEIAEVLAAAKAVSPPAQVSDWHARYIILLRALKGILDSKPEDDSIFFTLFGITFLIQEAEDDLANDVRDRLEDARCIEDSGTANSSPSGPDDHGNHIDDATAVSVGEATGGVIDYEGDVDYFRFTAERGVLYQIDVELGTLRDSGVSLWGFGGWQLAFNNDFEDSRASRITWEALESGDYYVQVFAGWRSSTGAGSYTLRVTLSDIMDDHGNSVEGATAIPVGVATGGVIDYEGDGDYFRFAADAGQLYQIDVELGTLGDSMVEVLNSDGWTLAHDNEFGDSSSRIIWEAPEPGDYYVAVAGYGAGSYTLTVSLSAIVDDHGNSIDGATAVSVGEATGGVIDYEGDEDYFRFTAQAGVLYEIDVALGTLDGSGLDLLDSDGWILASKNDIRDSSSRIIWNAPDSGDYYFRVIRWSGLGTYTLTVTLSTIVDDHGTDTDSATAVSVGEATGGVIDYEGDRDFFVFQAQEGTVYRIDVALGTLDDSVVELLNADGWSLEYNEDFGDSRASRIIWGAQESGGYYVEVGGMWEATGTYTLTVEIP